VPPGCAFHPRCAFCGLTNGLAETEVPQMIEIGGRHQVACHLPVQTRTEIWLNQIKPKL
jgi:peptide/nickel transport system ATP-binding protein